ncbi:MAG TPA: CbtA family protein [Pseudolabrys sp.]|nr:CbtA family protein [Pseudolabrys sp.]
MSVFRSIVFSAAVAGLIAGAIVTIVQQIGTVPLILKAEGYERAADATQPRSAAGEHVNHERHDEAAWQPQEGLERTIYTAGANILTAIGFSLLLAGFYALRQSPITWREGVVWGFAGFAVFTVAPGLGLPPELPGVPAAPLGERQIWWTAAALSTAVGLGLFAFRRSIVTAVAGLCLLVAPHLIGAPRLAEIHTNVPEALSHQFVVAVTLTSLLFWILLGGLTSIAYRRFSTGNQRLR